MFVLKYRSSRRVLPDSKVQRADYSIVSGTICSCSHFHHTLLDMLVSILQINGFSESSSLDLVGATRANYYLHSHSFGLVYFGMQVDIKHFDFIEILFF
jgi:hypothetical protein